VRVARLALVLPIAFVGCGGGSDNSTTQPAPLPSVHPVHIARCELGGGAASDWRKHSTALGPVGFYGPGRDFRKAPKLDKVPIIVEGSKPVTLSIAPADRSHAGILVISAGPYSQVRFIPCPGQPRTGWAGGFLLRNRQPVRVLVQVGDGDTSGLTVGRP
jgi:hypothetical protein